MDLDGEFYKKHAIVQEKKARDLIEGIYFADSFSLGCFSIAISKHDRVIPHRMDIEGFV